jgi:hypothetical protein
MGQCARCMRVTSTFLVVQGVSWDGNRVRQEVPFCQEHIDQALAENEAAKARMTGRDAER